MKNKKSQNVVMSVVFLLSLFTGINADDTDTIFGKDAGHSNTTGHYNTFIGCQVGFANTSGKCNTFVGYRSGYKNTAGSNNTFFGYKAGYFNTVEANTFVGYCAGYKSTIGNYNTFLGYEAGFANNFGKYNTFVGYQAGYSITGGANTFLGYRAGKSSTEGEYNTFLGYQAGYSNITGKGNIFIGYNAGYNESRSNRLYIANGANEENVLLYGDFECRCVGIATTSLDSSYRLDVNGIIRAQGLVKTSDARLKADIKPIRNALDKITSLRGVTFRWKGEKKDNGPQLGVIGQEVEKVFPEAVSTDNKSYKSVAYSNLVAPLIEAVKELKAENDKLKARVEALEKKIND